MRFSIFRSFLLGTKSIIPHSAKNVNTFLKIIFHFLPSAGNEGILGKIPATFGEKRVAENEKEKSCFFLVKKRKKRRKPGKSEMKENGRQRNETSDVSKRKTVDKMRYPQLEDKNAVSSVDNCG